MPVAASQEKPLDYHLEFLGSLFIGSFSGKELMILMSMNQPAWSERPLGEVSEGTCRYSFSNPGEFFFLLAFIKSTACI